MVSMNKARNNMMGMAMGYGDLESGNFSGPPTMKVSAMEESKEEQEEVSDFEYDEEADASYDEEVEEECCMLTSAQQATI